MMTWKEMRAAGIKPNLLALNNPNYKSGDELAHLTPDELAKVYGGANNVPPAEHSRPPTNNVSPATPSPTPPTQTLQEAIRLPQLPCSNPAAFVPATVKSMLDHALDYIGRGLHVFPCDQFLGLPQLDNWYAGASTNPEKVVQWWSADPSADVAAVPEKSGHYVIVATGDTGRESLHRFEMKHGVLKPTFRYANLWDCEHLWFLGKAYSARIDLGLHLIGAGRYVYLSPSAAPNPTAWAR
jgi:hypothetical protein